jgi:hypothetical protein
MTCVMDLTGQRFGRLQVVELGVRLRKGKTMWVCVCDCGQTKPISANCLRRATTRSCGCLRRETMLANRYVPGATT